MGGWRTRLSCCLLAVAGAAALPGSASATSPGADGALAFTVGNELPAQEKNLVQTRPDGSGRVQLTGLTEPVNDLAPVFSPDGNRIAIGRCMPQLGGCGDGIPVWIMNADGTGARLLTTSYDGTATWSPDGTRLAVLDTQPELGIYVINADGTNRHLLIKGSYGGTGSPTWSPDGTKIAFYDDAIVGEPHALGLYLVDVAGDVNDVGRKHLLLADDQAPPPNTCTDIEGYAFDWSPDGSKLLYRCVENDGMGAVNADLATVDAVTGTSTVVVDTPGTVLVEQGIEWFPRWSPDGTKIVYERESKIWTASADGTSQQPLMPGYRPSWQPCVATTVRCGPPPVPAGTGGTGRDGTTPGGGDGTTPGGDACPLADGPASNQGCPLNTFKLGTTQLTHHGTVLRLTLPGPGTVSIARTKLTRPASRRVASAGVVKLTVRPTAAGRRRLAAKRRITTRVPVTFTPTGGIAKTTRARIKLIR